MAALDLDSVVDTGDKEVRLWPRHPPSAAHQWIAEYAVHIAPSTIPGAGNGVFATVDLAANRILSYYRGRHLTKDEFDAEFGETQATYVLQVSHNTYVDAADPRHRNWTAIINDTKGTGNRPNCVFTAAGCVKTSRAIKAGEELFTSYGAAYWS